jgi:class 3 adenylate cyclase
MESASASVARYFVPQGVLQRLVCCPDPRQLTKKIAEVAVLFVDVQGCSTLCEVLPLPVMNRLLERTFGDFFACVQDAGGDVNEIMGDGFMALFEGRPLCASVDAAAHAALAIHQHVETYRGATGLPEMPLVVNMGLHAGSAFVGMTRFANRHGERWTYTASGPVTNVAARLCALAQDGAMLLSDVVATCLAGAFLLHPLGGHHFKNIGPLMQVYRLLGTRPETPQP